jgi:hypothetical protein
VHNSVYITFQDVVYGCDWAGEPQQLIQEIYKNRLRDYLNKQFDSFAEKAGTKNIQNLEFDSYSNLAQVSYCLHQIL